MPRSGKEHRNQSFIGNLHELSGLCQEGCSLINSWFIQMLPEWNLFKTNSTLCEFILSPLFANALAVRSALSPACWLGHKDIVVFSDCQVFTNAISGLLKLVEIYGILLNIFNYISSLSSVSCVSIPRNFNRIIDNLAKDVLKFYSHFSWMNEKQIDKIKDPKPKPKILWTLATPSKLWE